MYEERDNTDKTARMLRRIRVFSFAHIVRYLITRHQSYIRNILEADLYLFILVFSFFFCLSKKKSSFTTKTKGNSFCDVLSASGCEKRSFSEIEEFIAEYSTVICWTSSFVILGT